MKLQIGVVGVGAAWESRHLPALRALSDRFEVCAICDPVRHHAEQAARQFGTPVHDGFRTLTQRSDIDGVLLLSANFFGAAPIYAACDAGKAVYCAAAIDLKDNQASHLRQRVEESGTARGRDAGTLLSEDIKPALYSRSAFGRGPIISVMNCGTEEIYSTASIERSIPMI